MPRKSSPVDYGDDFLDFIETSLGKQRGGREDLKQNKRTQKYDDWVQEYTAKKAYDVPLIPRQFYHKLGLMRHPEDNKKIIKDLADYQYEIWESMLQNKYTMVVKSQKSGISTSVLMADFQRAIMPTSDPRSCRGMEILIVGQSVEIAKQHIDTLRHMIMTSNDYSPWLISEPAPWMLEDEVTKVHTIFLHNPDDPRRPTKIIGRGPTPRSLWSWKNVKHVHMSDIAILTDEQQKAAIEAALSRLANTDGSMIIETPPQFPSGKVYEIAQKSREKTDVEAPEGQFKFIRVHWRDAVNAGIIKMEKIAEYKVFYGPTFPMYFEAEFQASGGNVFDLKDIERAEERGKTVDIDRPNPYSPTVVAADPGFGSSKFGIVVAQLNNDRIEIVFAEEYETSTPSEMIKHCAELAQGYYAHNVYIDGWNRGIVQELKQLLNDNPTIWEDLIQEARQSNRRPDDFMKVVPINFGTQGKELLFHSQKLVHDGLVAINPAFDKLLAQMRSAIEIRGNLDKSRHTMDLLDAFRMACYFFQLKPIYE